ncbi:MAG TPA: LapA family protein [Candidatus Dormibacteraeota bacterium]|nr:LapA family protein [Candidatus Dormibacteraeota bacterium]
MPDLSHFWQRLLRATALVVGLAVGVGVTVFAYSNTAPANVGWANVHFNAVPLWTVAVVPLAIALAVGAVYHWVNNLHHFTEHMKHRRRVKELEAELASLRGHLDTALGMPDHHALGSPAAAEPIAEPEPEPDKVETKPLEPVASNGDKTAVKKKDRKPTAVLSETEPVAVKDSEAKPQETKAQETPAEA